MKKIQAAIVALVAASAAAVTVPWHSILPMSMGVLKVWSTNERVQNTDLNANFSTLNTTKVGGGVTLTNADVNSSAGIAHSKLATPALLPKAWASTNGTACLGADASDVTTCTLADSSQVTSIKSSGTAGQYRVTLAYTPGNTAFGVQVTSHTASVYCIAIPTTGTAFSTSAPQFQVACRSDANTQTNANFTLTVYDS